MLKYLLFDKQYHGVYEIESGSGVTKENISEKNTQLKEKNSDHEVSKIADSLFIYLSKQN